MKKGKQIFILSGKLAMLVVFVLLSMKGYRQRYNCNHNIYILDGVNIKTTQNPKTDTQWVVDQETGKEEMKILSCSPEPIMADGYVIFDSIGVSPSFKGNGESFQLYILKNLKNELSVLSDGMFDVIINDIIIDKNARLIYFKVYGITRYYFDNKHAPSVDEGTINEKIIEKICRLLEHDCQFTPAKINGKNVTSFFQFHSNSLRGIAVKDHQMQYWDNRILKTL